MKSSKFHPIAVLFSALVLLGGCGFHLRGDIPGSPKDKTIFVSGMNSGSFYNSFTQAMTVAGGIPAAKMEDASAVVHIATARHIRRPITLSAIGRANMFDLTFRVIYDIQNPKGDTLIPEQELNIRREYFNTQASPLGQGLEEVQLRQEMEQEAAQTLLRRVVFSLRDKNADTP